MGFWEKELGNGAPAGRPVSTPARGGDWYPTPQYSPPPSAEPWARPSVDPVQRAEGEISQQVLDFMEDSDGTWDYGRAGSGIQAVREDGTALGLGAANPMFLREIPDGIDPAMLSMADRHEYYWQRAARAPLRGRGRALRVVHERCPECGDPRYFTRG